MDRKRLLVGTLFAGKTLLVLIFLVNALGLVDQTRAAHEMATYGVPVPFVPAAIWAGRLAQLIGAVLVLFRSDWLAVIGALLLFCFVGPATLIAHSFWNATGDDRALQLANFLKNLSMMGGLLCLTVLLARPRTEKVP